MEGVQGTIRAMEVIPKVYFIWIEASHFHCLDTGYRENSPKT